MFFLGLWNHVFLFSNLSLFVLLPFAYLFTESEGFIGYRKVRNIIENLTQYWVSECLNYVGLFGYIFSQTVITRHDECVSFLKCMYKLYSFIWKGLWKRKVIVYWHILLFLLLWLLVNGRPVLCNLNVAYVLMPC